MSKGEKVEQKQGKSRTPSGTELANTVSATRTIFSPENGIFQSIHETRQGDTHDTHDKSHQDALTFPAAVTPSRSSEHKRKQTEDGHDQESQSVKVLRQSCISFAANKLQLQRIKVQEDSDSEHFSTPPGTPIRKGRIQKKKKTTVKTTLTSTMPTEEQMQIDTLAKQTEDQSDNFKQIYKEVIEDGPNNSSNIRSEDGEVEGDVDQMPMTMDIRSVHAMFRKLEQQMQDKLDKISTNNINRVEENQETIKYEDYQKIQRELTMTKIKNRALNSAVQVMWEEMEDMAARLSKLELNEARRAVVITGLYTSDKKGEAMDEFQEFILEYFGFKPEIADLYPIGQGSPAAKVVIFMNQAEKELIMENKSLLKDVQNEDKKGIYINNYLLPAEKAKRNKEREIRNREKELNPQNADLISFKKGKMFKRGIEIEQIRTPNPQDILSLTEDKLDEILQMKIKKGPEIKEEGNIFGAFTMEVNSIQQVSDAYLKMKLSYPKARHIVCAYYIPTECSYQTIGHCDDGEHEAGARLLRILMENNITHRVLFVTRHYSQKIGPARFTCMEKAARICLEQYPMNEYLDEMQHFKTAGEEFTDEDQDNQENGREDATNLEQQKDTANTFSKIVSARGGGNKHLTTYQPKGRGIGAGYRGRGRVGRQYSSRNYRGSARRK